MTSFSPALAADVGGTHARIAAASLIDGQIELRHFRKFRCVEFASMTAIFERYCQDHEIDSPSSISAAIAGATGVGDPVCTNMPWEYRLDDFRHRFSASVVQTFNDYQAVAAGSQLLTAEECISVTSPEPDPDGLAIVMGVGTGLGAAIRAGSGPNARIYPTELGQTRLRAEDPLQLEILKHLGGDNEYVRVEKALSGPGIAATYAALRQVLGLSELELQPSEVVARATIDGDPIALAVVEIVVGILAEVVADLAVMLAPFGGIYLSGGVTPKIAGFINSDTFREKFLANAPMRTRLEQVPIRIVNRDDIGVLGAALLGQVPTTYKKGN